jgi:hypothetical protein
MAQMWTSDTARPIALGVYGHLFKPADGAADYSAETTSG